MHNLLPFLHAIFHADPHPARSLRDVNVFLPTSDCDAIQMDLLVLISRVLGLVYTYPDTFINVYFSMRLQLVYMKTIDVCVYRVST